MESVNRSKRHPKATVPVTVSAGRRRVTAAGTCSPASSGSDQELEVQPGLYLLFHSEAALCTLAG